MPRTKKLQLPRLCGICKKSGHNKSTCPERMEKLERAEPRKTVIQKSSIQPIRFFVHHVPYQTHKSDHLVDLKKEKSDSWQHVKSAAPENNRPEHDYFFYHEKSEKNSRAEYSPSTRGTMEPAHNKDGERRHSFHLPTFKLPRLRLPLTPALKYISNSFLSALKLIGQIIAWPFKKILGAARSVLYALDNIRKQYLSLQKFAFALAALIVILILPIQTRSYYQSLKISTAAVADNSASGFLALQESTSAIMQGNIELAENSLTNALQNFDQAVTTMENKHRSLQTFFASLPIVGQEVQSRQKLILAGQALTLGNAYMLKGIKEAQNASSTLSYKADTVLTHVKAALPSYAQALENLSAIDVDVLPYEYQSTFNSFKVLFTAFLNDLKSLSELQAPMREIFGDHGLRRYLLVFQNPFEIRPTGGFMGSFAFMEMKDGQVMKLDVPPGGAYDLQGQLSQYVEPPAPLLLANKRWEMQDANWFPDFPASAKKILWFYRQSRGITADGVMALNATVLERLLAVSGPVADDKRQLSLTNDSALKTIQNVIEYGEEKSANRPKQILTDLAPKFLANLQQVESDKLLPLLINLQESLLKKEIQLYFTDERAERTVKSFGWGGNILASNSGQDYLMVINTNIQGQKSDAHIKQTISHQAVVETDGSVYDAVTVKRIHQGQAGEKLYGQTNIDYIRLYAPEGSELMQASGFVWPDETKFKAPESWYKKDATLEANEIETGLDEKSGTRITREFGKTAFGNWIITEPGQTSEAQFVYKLPFKIDLNAKANLGVKITSLFGTTPQVAKYQLVAQKQSGVESDFESQVIFPNGWHPVWADGESLQLASNGAFVATTLLDRDRVWSLVMEKK